MPRLPEKVPPPPRWVFTCVAVAVFAFLFSVHARMWTTEHGITKFLRVGREFDDRALAVFRATPKFIDPYPAHRWGFDGQLYAQMALDPLLRDPHLHVALDDPPYRGQRILLSWLAWAMGLGKPFWVINAFAALNLIFWVGFAWLAHRLFTPLGWAGLAGYAALLPTCGVIESMHAALTDLPSFTLILAAVTTGGTAGAVWLALAALARTTSLIGFVGLAEFSPPWREAIRRNIIRGLIAAVPIALWVAYVLWVFRGRQVGFDGGNLAAPFRGIMEKLGELSVTLPHGPVRWHRWWYEFYKSYELHALLTIVAVVTQGVYLALHRDWRSPIWRWGAVTALYFSCISFLSWESHFTITRHALPMTLAFNLLLALRPTRAWLLWFFLGNCFVPFGVRYFDRAPAYFAPAPPAEFSAAAGSGISAAFGEGWAPQQWDGETTWRWARGEEATLVVRNAGLQARRVELRLLAGTVAPRDLSVAVGGRTFLTVPLTGSRHVVVVPAIELPPGETRIVLRSPQPAADAVDTTPGQVTLRVERPRLGPAPP
ncbi:MAG: hypothetical protein JNL39_01605 [Opitutaceae bacterium]|nr:hypothetical protein [Opitutaceae bacterium]